MGIWEAVAPTADGIKGSLPKPAPLKSACSSAYGISASSFGAARAYLPDLSPASAFFWRSTAWLYRTARVDAPRLLSAVATDPATLSKISRISWNLLDCALDLGSRPYTGRFPVYRIVKEGLYSDDAGTAQGEEMSDIKRRLEKLEALEAAREEKAVLQRRLKL